MAIQSRKTIYGGDWVSNNMQSLRTYMSRLEHLLAITFLYNNLKSIQIWTGFLHLIHTYICINTYESDKEKKSISTAHQGGNP